MHNWLLQRTETWNDALGKIKVKGIEDVRCFILHYIGHMNVLFVFRKMDVTSVLLTARFIG